MMNILKVAAAMSVASAQISNMVGVDTSKETICVDGSQKITALEARSQSPPKCAELIPFSPREMLDAYN